ncbi:Uncharacterised protein [Anaerobiospirillum thomasii]|uniref:ATP-dependent Clp protease proteolytic subunit n=1 Tax=Anaerobiospirillum thomasii TaxID=179995 RepID=UPI000D8FB9FF|nr:ATP-dependent Clp protease proteolytic subunit [Anaerobiospirillum thomasii]SPT68739.1 Uncharacterised protein [Anaerobiospirillum thomasii]
MISFNKKSNTLYISGAIEGAHFFKEGDSNTVFELSQYDTARALNVVINSPGGSTNEGLAIKNLFRIIGDTAEDKRHGFSCKCCHFDHLCQECPCHYAKGLNVYDPRTMDHNAGGKG